MFRQTNNLPICFICLKPFVVCSNVSDTTPHQNKTFSRISKAPCARFDRINSFKLSSARHSRRNLQFVRYICSLEKSEIPKPELPDWKNKVREIVKHYEASWWAIKANKRAISDLGPCWRTCMPGLRSYFRQRII